jgi:hypothetical protein
MRRFTFDASKSTRLCDGEIVPRAPSQGESYPVPPVKILERTYWHLQNRFYQENRATGATGEHAADDAARLACGRVSRCIRSALDVVIETYSITVGPAGHRQLCAACRRRCCSRSQSGGPGRIVAEVMQTRLGRFGECAVAV